MQKSLYLLPLIAGLTVLSAFSWDKGEKTSWPGSQPLFVNNIADFQESRSAPQGTAHPAFLLNNLPQPAPIKWKPDKAHSSVRFSVKHLVVSESEGYFKSFDGSMEHTKPDFSDAKIRFTVDVNSIDTDSEKRDAHLKSEDFFNVAQYPVISFVSTSFKPGNRKKYKLYGNLTLRGITRPIVFDVVYGGTLNSGKDSKAIFTCTSSINRFDYGLQWSKATEAGGLVVGQDVAITVKMEMNKVNE